MGFYYLTQIEID